MRSSRATGTRRGNVHGNVGSQCAATDTRSRAAPGERSWRTALTADHILNEAPQCDDGKL
jgi:hypothetical protein